MLYFCNVKRKLRTYLSILVLFCLTLQCGVFGLYHMSDHDHNEHDHHACCDAQDHHDLTDSKSTVVLNALNDCDGCDLLMDLDKQSFADVIPMEFTLDPIAVIIKENLTSQYEDNNYLLLQGRAPPRA